MHDDEFRAMIWQQGEALYREMPWREDPSPYMVWVSELMLQQTQVGRVVPKFEAFMRRFPDIAALSDSSLADVLTLWSGLGYNRRAKFLWQAALELSLRFNGQLPRTHKELVSLPGIGPNTAAAILNYAYEIPTAFVETNIRTVYFHHFFDGKREVSDHELLQVVSRTQDTEHPRQWYWALMDYGAHLKATAGGRLDVSKHYKKQSPLAGSPREMRGHIIRELTIGTRTLDDLKRAVQADARFEPALASLQREGMVEELEGQWRLRA